MEDQTIQELSVALSERDPVGGVPAELPALLRDIEADGAAVVDGPEVLVLTDCRLLRLSVNDHGVVVASRRVPNDVAIRREPTGREQRGPNHNGMKSRWSFTSPADPEFDFEVEGWGCTEHDDEDATEHLARTIAEKFGWPALDRSG